MRYFIVLFLVSLSVFAQKPEAWLTKEAEENPEAYIKKAETIVPATPAEAAGRFFVLGRCYSYLNKEDIALKYYILSKKEFEKLKLREPAKDLALEIHQVISSQENYEKYGRSFLDEYFSYAKSTQSNERLAKSWNEFGKYSFDEYDFENNTNPEVLDKTSSLFLKALNYAKKTDDSRIKTHIYANLGTLENTRKNFDTARKYLDSARVFTSETKNQNDLFVNLYSYGNSYFLQANYNKAIEWFKKAEKIDIPAYKGKTLRLLYKKLMESYDLVDDQQNRRKYQKLYLDLDNAIKDHEQNVAIHDINVKYLVTERDREISSLEKFRDKFHKNRLVFGILLFVVFLMALYSFVRWKKLDFRKQKLEVEKELVVKEKIKIEEEHSITVQELEKVKSIVTEGYIILKDKSKVYLNDLMYIKSDDHYLHTFSADGKTQFVRGKLSQILLELPPNFVKCHRSYIVNSNYIHSIHTGYIVLKNKTEIPVSRGFKL